MKKDQKDNLFFGIRAECRTRKKRVILYSGWTKEQAKKFKATPAIKKLYRYFRVVNVNNYPT